MPNDTGLGIGAGLMKGFNAVLLPYLERQGQAQQQAAIMQTKELRDETRQWVEELMHTGLWDPEKNELDAKANTYLYSGWNAKPPPELAYFFANARNRLTKTADLVGSGGSAQVAAPSPSTPTAPPAVANQPAPAAPADPTAGNTYGSPMGVPGSNGQFAPANGTVTLPGGQKAEAPTTPGEILVAPGQPNPVEGGVAPAPAPAPVAPTVDVQRLDTPEARAAARIEDRQNRGLTDFIQVGKKHRISFTGATFTERQKLAGNKAARAVLNGARLEDALANVDDPKMREGVAKLFASEHIRQMVATGMFDEKQAVEAVAGMVGKDLIPKQYYDAVYGPREAATKAAATAQATQPIQVETARQTAENAAQIREKYKNDPDHRLMVELNIDPAKPVAEWSPTESAAFNAVKAERQRTGVWNKEVTKIRAQEEMEPSRAVKRSELKNAYDPATGKPVTAVLRGQNRSITYGDLTNLGAIDLDQKGIDIIRSAPQAHEILQQYLSASLKVFKSEDPDTNLGDFYTKWLTADPDYQDLVSENGKLSTIIRMMRESGALSESDTKRGQDSLLQMRGRVSKSQIIQSVQEVNTIMQKGLDAMGFDAEAILPTPKEAEIKRLPVLD